MKRSHLIQQLKNAMHGIYSVCGMMRYGVLGKKMFVIGITGTDGKSSSVIVTAAILRRAGHKVAHFSSISHHDGLAEQVNEHKMTMLGRMGLHEFLSRAHKNGCTYAVVEVTSQGIIQHRHRGIAFSGIGMEPARKPGICRQTDDRRRQSSRLCHAGPGVRRCPTSRHWQRPGFIAGRAGENRRLCI
jgi:hypothetical protein